jgi:prolyl-tRNA editing enzyme YbaK/EbsC (Cys-tRNA(Pro) deacylase)
MLAFSVHWYLEWVTYDVTMHNCTYNVVAKMAAPMGMEPGEIFKTLNPQKHIKTLGNFTFFHTSGFIS